MSEQGRLAFLEAEGVDDWVVLHGGATAVFRVPSLTEAARLAEAVAHVPGLDGSGALVTLADPRIGGADHDRRRPAERAADAWRFPPGGPAHRARAVGLGDHPHAWCRRRSRG